jgi:N-acetylglucosaminyl-diphospho-decaprenol L-rhamnosyltransferase
VADVHGRHDARAVEVSYCVVNTEGRALLERCLDAIARDRAPDSEVLVLDNASTDGSAEMARAHPVGAEVIALDRRRGKAENDSALLARARGRFGLLLNEDSELRPGATAALVAALEAAPRAGAAGARLLRPDGGVQPSAFRFPTVRASLLGAVGLARLNVQSRGDAVREVDWAHSAAMLVRRSAGEEVGWLDPAFFVYSDEVDFCKRLRDAGWSILYVPGAEAVHHEQLSTGAGAARRIVEFSRNRDRYVRKHHGRVVAAVVRWLTALAYVERAAAALVLPGHSASRYWQHVRATLRPGRGEGIAEAAAAFNAERDRAAAAS